MSVKKDLERIRQRQASESASLEELLQLLRCAEARCRTRLHRAHLEARRAKIYAEHHDWEQALLAAERALSHFKRRDNRRRDEKNLRGNMLLIKGVALYKIRRYEAAEGCLGVSLKLLVQLRDREDASSWMARVRHQLEKRRPDIGLRQRLVLELTGPRYNY